MQTRPSSRSIISPKWHQEAPITATNLLKGRLQVPEEQEQEGPEDDAGQ